MQSRRSFFGTLAGLVGLGGIAKIEPNPGEVKLTAKKLVTRIKVPNGLLASPPVVLSNSADYVVDAYGFTVVTLKGEFCYKRDEWKDAVGQLALNILPTPKCGWRRVVENLNFCRVGELDLCQWKVIDKEEIKKETV